MNHTFKHYQNTTIPIDTKHVRTISKYKHIHVSIIESNHQTYKQPLHVTQLTPRHIYLPQIRISLPKSPKILSSQ